MFSYEFFNKRFPFKFRENILEWKWNKTFDRSILTKSLLMEVDTGCWLYSDCICFYFIVTNCTFIFRSLVYFLLIRCYCYMYTHTVPKLCFYDHKAIYIALPFNYIECILYSKKFKDYLQLKHLVKCSAK